MAGQRGLTAAVRSDDGGKFPFFDLHRYIFERIKSFAFLRFKSMGNMADIKKNFSGITFHSFLALYTVAFHNNKADCFSSNIINQFIF